MSAAILEKRKRGRPCATDGATQAEIAAELGVSETRVQQLEARALKKLRAMLEAMGFER